MVIIIGAALQLVVMIVSAITKSNAITAQEKEAFLNFIKAASRLSLTPELNRASAESQLAKLKSLGTQKNAPPG